MKRNPGRRLLAAVLVLLIVSSLFVIPVSASSYTNAYNKLVAHAKTGVFYSGSYDILEGEHYYYIGHDDYHIPEYEYLNEVFMVAYSTLDHLELRVGCNERWVWVIVPKTPGALWEIKGLDYKSIVSRGSVLIDPATYCADTELTLSSYQGDESFRNQMLGRIKEFFSRMLDYTAQELASLGCTLADLGFLQYPDNDAHDWTNSQGAGFHRPASCTKIGFDHYICMYCGAEKTITLPAMGHSWTGPFEDKAATCTSSGLSYYYCTRCGRSQSETVPALGHDWSYVETLTPTVGDEHGTARYSCARCGGEKEDRLCAELFFTDMPPEGNWAHAPIDWAFFSGLTVGKGDGRFAPRDTVTRAEVMTFLWITLHRPEPVGTENPFLDIQESNYFYKPVLWAVEQGVTSGVAEDAFGPGQPCTRAQIMTFLWIAAGRPEPETAENPFTDVAEENYFYKPVLWAVEHNVTGGTSADSFSPYDSCTRAQVLAFLFKTQALLNGAETPAAPETP